MRAANDNLFSLENKYQNLKSEVHLLEVEKQNLVKIIQSYDSQATALGKTLDSYFIHCEQEEKKYAKWGYFIIKHIEEYGIDDKVGVGKELPQIYFIPNQGQLYQAQNDFLDCCEKSRKHMEENLKNLLSL